MHYFIFFYEGVNMGTSFEGPHFGWEKEPKYFR